MHAPLNALGAPANESSVDPEIAFDTGSGTEANIALEHEEIASKYPIELEVSPQHGEVSIESGPFWQRPVSSYPPLEITRASSIEELRKSSGCIGVLEKKLDEGFIS